MTHICIICICATLLEEKLKNYDDIIATFTDYLLSIFVTEYGEKEPTEDEKRVWSTTASAVSTYNCCCCCCLLPGAF